MKVLLAASECAPMVKVGGLADVVGSLPKALEKLGLEVAVAIPNYAAILKEKPKTLPGSSRIQLFYLGQAEDFSGSPYPGGYQEHERFANFSRQVANFLDTRNFEPEVIHCHDYHTSLIPDILKERKKKIATVLTIHDVQNQGLADPSVLSLADLSSRFLRVLDFDLKDGNLDMLLQGILGSDVINTVSPTYAREILREEVSGSLADVLKAREARVFGILNGLDQDFFDPAKDSRLLVNYGLANFQTGKRQNKLSLQEELGLKKDENVALFALVTRLVERKGLDLVVKILPSLVDLGQQLVILGRGEVVYEEMFTSLNKQFAGSFAFVNVFDEALAHKIYAGSDFFLVPSKTEPCGLTQMIASRYGSLPIVRSTGGLADTVEDNLTGFVFADFSPEALLTSVKRAIDVFVRDPPSLSLMVARAMKKDFSWEKSARSYLKLYEKALEYSFGIARGLAGEIRHDVLGGWTILSEGRAQRPKEETRNSNLEVQSLALCPFEEGREPKSPGEVFRLGPGQPDTPGWQVRVVANKFPLLPGHEVVIYSPDHEKDLDKLPLLWVEKVVWAYLSRYRHYEENGYIHIFCNHGRGGAASLSHPHSQIIVFDELAQATINALEAGQKYYSHYHSCPYCDTIQREIKGNSHFVWQNELMVLLTPYSSDWPYEMTLLPKRHRQSFSNIDSQELKDFAQGLQMAVRLLKEEFNDPPYNFWIHSLPNLLGFAKSALYYHWHLDLIPRIKVLGGLELGLGVMVDDFLSPEKAAQILRGQTVQLNG